MYKYEDDQFLNDLYSQPEEESTPMVFYLIPFGIIAFCLALVFIVLALDGVL